MTAIKQEDLIQSVADAFQYISYYHPLDYIKALGEAYAREESPAAKDAIAQILTNSRMSAEGHRPICQDTGIGMVFLKVGMSVTWPDATMSLQQMIDEGVRINWGRIPHFYRAFYVYQYATGLSAAIALASAIRDEGEPARERYLTLLASGGKDYPLNLLKQAGVDLTTPEPIEAALAEFERVVAEMERIVDSGQLQPVA